MVEDLFPYYKELPKEVNDLIDNFGIDAEDTENIYTLCKQFVTDLEKVGYTCDYG